MVEVVVTPVPLPTYIPPVAAILPPLAEEVLPFHGMHAREELSQTSRFSLLITTRTMTPTPAAWFRLVTTVIPEGLGSVLVSPASANGFYSDGTVVVIAASCSFGFVVWAGDVPKGVSMRALSILVTMDKDRALTAICAESADTPAFPTPTSTPTPTPTQVPATATRIPIPTQVALTTAPIPTPTQVPPTATPTPTPTLAARFRLVTTVIPEGLGSVQVDPASADGFYSDGTVVVMTASCSFGFVLWAGDVPKGVSTGPLSILVTMDKDRALTALCADTPTPTQVPSTSTPTPTATQIPPTATPTQMRLTATPTQIPPTATATQVVNGIVRPTVRMADVVRVVDGDTVDVIFQDGSTD